jgi:hypothetical protein
MVPDRASFLARLFRVRQATVPTPMLPLLEYVHDPQAAEWLRLSMTSFAESVASILPGHFASYARIYHPFESHASTSVRATSWHDLAAEAGVRLGDPAVAADFAYHGVEGSQAEVGRLPPVLIGPLVEHLRQATTTPDRCVFAVWEGHGDLAVSAALEPALELPHRRYHIFQGPIEGAHTSFSAIDVGYLSPNLWWPADQAWCVATEIDFAWSYVGGPESLVNELLVDLRLEAVEITASARW